MIVMGIDNGVSGAVAWMDDQGMCPHVAPTPTITVKAGKRTRTKYDEPGMRSLLQRVIRRVPVRVAIEAARVSPKFPAFSAGVLMEGYGLWRGLLVGLGVPYEVVEPRRWQKALLDGLPKGDTKAASVLVAKRLFPAVSLRRTERSRTDDHNIADALLIAEYGRRQQGGGNG